MHKFFYSFGTYQCEVFLYSDKQERNIKTKLTNQMRQGENKIYLFVLKDIKRILISIYGKSTYWIPINQGVLDWSWYKSGLVNNSEFKTGVQLMCNKLQKIRFFD